MEPEAAQKGAIMEPSGAKGEQKGAKKEARVAKGGQKGAKKEPTGDQNPYQKLAWAPVSKKGAKNVNPGFAFGFIFDAFLVQLGVEK